MIIRKCDLCGKIIEHPVNGIFDCELPARIEESYYGPCNTKLSFYTGYNKQKKDICISCANKIIHLINNIQKENNNES